MTSQPSPRRRKVIDALRRGTVPVSGLDLLAVALTGSLRHGRRPGDGGRRRLGIQGRPRRVRGRQDVLHPLSRRTGPCARAFAATEVQISETQTPLHRLETVYRRITESLRTASYPPSAFRPVLDSWLFILEADAAAADPALAGTDHATVTAAASRLLNQRLDAVTRQTLAQSRPANHALQI
jgi:hypothetical protein